jgi:hypothetical protein
MSESFRDLQPEAGNARDISRMETHQRAGEPALPLAEGLMLGLAHDEVVATYYYLSQAKTFRARGYRVSYVTDPTWLLNMAINRKAGWPDDPGLSRGSARPVEGRYPAKADGDHLKDLRLLSRRLNGHGSVSVRELGLRLAKRLFNQCPERFDEDEWYRLASGRKRPHFETGWDLLFSAGFEVFLAPRPSGPVYPGVQREKKVDWDAFFAGRGRSGDAAREEYEQRCRRY